MFFWNQRGACDITVIVVGGSLSPKKLFVFNIVLIL